MVFFCYLKFLTLFRSLVFLQYTTGDIYNQYLSFIISVIPHTYILHNIQNRYVNTLGKIYMKKSGFC